MEEIQRSFEVSYSCQISPLSRTFKEESKMGNPHIIVLVGHKIIAQNQWDYLCQETWNCLSLLKKGNYIVSYLFNR